MSIIQSKSKEVYSQLDGMLGVYVDVFVVSEAADIISLFTIQLNV
jgi:hypothetical protein